MKNHKCTECGKLFTEHECVVAAQKLLGIELITKLYEHGACSKEFYETKLKEYLNYK